MTFLDALRRHGHRDHYYGGIPLRVLLTGHWTRPDLRRNYLPAMATATGRAWWTIAYWHRLQVGPVIVLWRTAVSSEEVK